MSIGQRVPASRRYLCCDFGHPLIGAVTTSADGQTEYRNCSEECEVGIAVPAPVVYYCKPSDATEDVA